MGLGMFRVWMLCRRHAKRDLWISAKSVDSDLPPSGQNLHFLTLVTPIAQIFLAVYTNGLSIAAFNIV